MPSLIVPAGVAQARRKQIEAQQSRGYGLGRAHHEIDPAEKILKQIGMTELGKLPGFQLFGNRILVGIYERPEKLESGVFLSDTTRREDEHQSKAALVLMMGHSAFKSDAAFDFGPDTLAPGNWVTLFINDGRKIVVNGQLCRLIRDQDVICRIPIPDVVY